MIRGEVLNGRKVAETLGNRGKTLRNKMSDAVVRLTMMLLRNVKSGKLSGQALNVRTGRLRRSINSRIENQGTDETTGIVGTNVVYARPHEYGFDGVVTVREHLRTVKKAFGRDIAPVQVTIAAHAVHMKLPERSFLRAALAEMEPTIKEELARALYG